MFYNHLPCLVNIDMENLHAFACMHACMQTEELFAILLSTKALLRCMLCVHMFSGGGQVLYPDL